MFKRLLTAFTLAAMVAHVPVAQASDLDSAFNSLMTYDTPGKYSTSTRTSFIAGGVDVRFPRSSTTVSLFSITPPTGINAGCNGISAHFGGFSFVSGAQIEALIKHIGQNATGMVVSLVIKTLCPICDAIIQAMTKLSQDAARLTINSCEVGTAIATNLMGMTGKSGDMSIKGMCTGNASMGTGFSGDALAAAQGVDATCASLEKSIGWVSDMLHPKKPDGTPDPAGKECPTNDAMCLEAKSKNMVGNLTWNALTAVYGPLDKASEEDLRDRQLLMNLLGFTIIATKDAAGNPQFPTYNYTPTISAKHMFDLFMCGAPGSYTDTGTVPADSGFSSSSQTTQEYCALFYAPPSERNQGMGAAGGYDYMVFVCNDLKGDPGCVHPVPMPLQKADLLRGQGFLPRVEMTLVKAVNQVRTNQGPFSKEFMSLVQNLNFPLYQAVNAAAVYPASAQALVRSLSILSAESLTVAKLNEMLMPQGKNPNPVVLPEDVLTRIALSLESVQKTHADQRLTFGRLMAVQEAAAASIRQVNLAIQKQVLTPQLLGNQNYGAAVAGQMAQQK